MEIKVQVDEAKIMKGVMDGLSTAQIEQRIIDDVMDRIERNVKDNMRSKISAFETKCERAASKKLIEDVKKEIVESILKEWTPTKLKKAIKGSTWESYLEDVIGETIGEFLDVALNEWMTLTLNVSVAGKKPKAIELSKHVSSKR